MYLYVTLVQKEFNVTCQDTDHSKKSHLLNVKNADMYIKDKV